jgi:hypothetical protein
MTAVRKPRGPLQSVTNVWRPGAVPLPAPIARRLAAYMQNSRVEPTQRGHIDAVKRLIAETIGD